MEVSNDCKHDEDGILSTNETTNPRSKEMITVLVHSDELDLTLRYEIRGNQVEVSTSEDPLGQPDVFVGNGDHAPIGDLIAAFVKEDVTHMATEEEEKEMWELYHQMEAN